MIGKTYKQNSTGYKLKVIREKDRETWVVEVQPDKTIADMKKNDLTDALLAGEFVQIQ